MANGLVPDIGAQVGRGLQFLGGIRGLQAQEAQQQLAQQQLQSKLAQQAQIRGLEGRVLGGLNPVQPLEGQGPRIAPEQQVAEGLKAQAELAVRFPDRFKQISENLGLITQQQKDEAAQFASEGIRLLQSGDQQGFQQLQQQRIANLAAQGRNPVDTQSLSEMTPDQQMQALQATLVSTLPPDRQIELSRAPLENVVEAADGGFIGIDPATRESVFVPPPAKGIKTKAQADAERARQDERVKESLEDTKTQFDRASKLRGEISKASDEFSKLNSAFGRIQASAKEPSAAGDIALIFNFMKMLDPGSVVREGEFATAQNATGVDQRFRNTYNQLLTGERLSEKQRKDFINQARNIFQGAQKENKNAINRIVDIGEQFGVSRDQILGRSDEQPIIRFDRQGRRIE